jgi:hypothetical protein
MKNLLMVLVVLSLIAISATAQNRGGENESGAVEIVDARNVPLQGKQWAVFIAIGHAKCLALIFRSVPIQGYAI